MIKFRHRNCEKVFIPATFAYDLPPPELFKELFNQAENIINFPFGVTWVHPKDKNYCKATGRYHALSNTKITQFYLHKIKIENKKILFELNTIKDCRVIELFITINPELSSVRLDHIEVTQL